MYNTKWGMISGGAALVLAFVTSLFLGHTSLLIAILRAVIFAVVFFGLGSGIWALINTFFPELLATSTHNDAINNVFATESSGGRVNITVEDAPAAAVPSQDHDGQGDGALENFSDMSTRSQSMEDIDQISQTSYTDPSEEISPVFESGGIGSLGGDFSMDFGMFFSGSSGDEAGNAGSAVKDTYSLLSDTGDSGDSPMPERKVSVNKPVKMEGDFNPKEIASGIRTVLEKDKKG